MADIQSVIEQMADAGLTGITAADLIVDGRVQRFRPDDSKSKTGWYVLFSFPTENGGALIAGKFGDWRWGNEGQKVAVRGTKLGADERRQLAREMADKARAAKQARQQEARRAAATARRVWQKLKITGSSPYLERKQIQGYGARFSRKHTLALPLLDMRGGIHGLQLIYPEPQPGGGDKRFWPTGVSKRGTFMRIGPEPMADDPLVLCEGYATGCSIHEASGFTVFVAWDCGNLAPVAQAVRGVYGRNPLIVAGDDDYQTAGNPGKSAATAVADKHRGVALVPKFAARAGEKWTDFNDLHVAEGLAAVREQVQAAARHPKFQDWRIRLNKLENGRPVADIGNTRLVLANDPAWAEVLGYCDFSYRTMKRCAPPFAGGETGEWSDADTNRLRIWLADNYRFTPRTADADGAIQVVAQGRRFHPVREYLESLPWDGENRVAYWPADVFGVEPLDDYAMAVAVKWMVASVARVMRAPVKADCVLILEGPQGLGKSEGLRILGGDWFSDTHFELGDKDGYQQMNGVWICEQSELDSFNKAETTRAKAFYSSQTDRYRPPYGHRPQDFARQCVFAGSTNQGSYLKDVTGNRRYWPLLCRKLDREYLIANRDQLWAEAVALYRQDVPWWPMAEELPLFEREQEARFAEDAWESLIVAWLDDPSQRTIEAFSTADILEGALRLQPHQMKPPEQMRVGLIMARLGWRKARPRKADGKRAWMYVRPAEKAEDAA